MKTQGDTELLFHEIFHPKEPQVGSLAFFNRWNPVKKSPFMANAILNFHFDYWNLSLIKSLNKPRLYRITNRPGLYSKFSDFQNLSVFGNISA